MYKWFFNFRSKTAKAAVLITAAVVVFVSTYLLVLPAFTIEREEAVPEEGFYLEDEADVSEADPGLETTDEPDAAAEDIVIPVEESSDEAAPGTEAVNEAVPVTEIFEETVPEVETVEEEAPAAVLFDETNSAESNNITVTVNADEGAFPEGCTVTAADVTGDVYIAGVMQNIYPESNGIAGMQAVDISFSSPEGNAVEPVLPVWITVGAGMIAEDYETLVYFVPDPTKPGYEGEQGKAYLLEQYTTPELKNNEILFRTGGSGSYVIVNEAVNDGIEEGAINYEENADINDNADIIKAEDVYGDENNIKVLEAVGGNYRITAKYGEETGIPENTELLVNEIENGSADSGKSYDEYVSDSESALGLDEGSAGYIRLFDIKIVDRDDPEIQYQPAEGTTVDVNIILDDAESSELNVVHFADAADPGNVVENVDVTGNTVSFEAEGFSVYAVVEGSTGEYARMKVEFYSNGTRIASMYVKNGDTAEELEEILYDPGAGVLGEGEMFGGWILDNEGYTTADVANAMTIAEVREWAENHPITEGETHRLDAAICKMYHITYKDTDGTVLGRDAVLVKSDEYGTAEVECTVKMAYTPKDDIHNFEGWTLDEETAGNVTSEIPEDSIYPNDSTITINGDISFTVNAPEGAWLVFDENGKGGKYNAPRFVKSDEVTEQPCPDAEMTRNGYTFGGWYDTKEHADAHGANPSVTTGKFTFGNALDEKTTLYASWVPNTTAPYTVILWGQNVDRDGYEVLGSYTNENGRVGQNIPYTFVNNGDEDYVTGVGNNNGHYTGFCLTEGSKNQQITITPEGDAVLNLYYDRIKYNFKFYLYRDGTTRNRYDYANNSGSGSDLNGLVTWHSNQTEHPSVTGKQILSETVGGRTYYYFVLEAYYGEDISAKWPKYDEIQGANNREAVSFVMMVGTKLKPVATNQGSGTVKGIITVMDENILGATNNANGNYVVIRFPNSYYNWRYHIWFETVDGEDYTGKTTHVWNGKTYYEETVLTVRSSNTTVTNQNAPNYEGFEFVDWRGQQWNNRNYWTTGNNPTLYHINQVYNRQTFQISYFDGNYVDGSGNQIQNRSANLLHESEMIPHGKIVPDEYKEYVPDAQEDGYIFAGWYIDEACTVEYKWGTMPIGGIIVYAKWVREEYRVFLHPNAGTDENLDWGSETVSTSFRVSYGGKVSAPKGTREGSGYEFVGWYTDPSLGSEYLYNADTILNNETVTTPYDKTEPTERDKYGNPTEEGNKDALNNRFWITKKLDLYAKWRKILEGAEGINVVYSADDGKGNVGTNPPVDESQYPDMADAVAQAADTAPEHMYFKCWVVQRWDPDANDGAGGYVDTMTTVLPGEKFTVSEEFARKQADPENPGEYIYTMQLRAEYGEPEGDLPTHIWWFENYSDEGADRHDSYFQNEDIAINEAVNILAAPEREGYEFLGWARVPSGVSESEAGTPAGEGTPATAPTGKVLNLTEDDLYLKYQDGQFKLVDPDSEYNGATVIQVAADERLAYHDMYAVWKKVCTATVQKILVDSYLQDEKSFTFTPVLTKNGEDITGQFFDETTFTLIPVEDEETGIVSAKRTFTVPEGAVLSVTETSEGEYTTTVDGVETLTGTVTITADSENEIVFTNTRKTVSIDLHKVDKESAELIPGSEFKLCRKNATGVYEADESIDATKADTVLQLTDGTLTIEGLPSGDYRLEEITPPDGYIVGTQYIYFTVNATGTGDVITKTDGQEAYDSETVGAYTEGAKHDTLVIPNTSGAALPMTGGQGTKAMYAAGLLLIALAGVAILMKRRKMI